MKQEKWSSHSVNRLDLKQQKPLSQMLTQSPERSPQTSSCLSASFVPSHQSPGQPPELGARHHQLSPGEVPDTLLPDLM